MNCQKLCVAILVFSFTIAVGLASAATCSKATLNGVYGSLDAGVNAGQPEATLTQFTADGNGNLTGTLTNSTNGVITSGTLSGTYTVATNCIGNYTVTFTNGTKARGRFFMDNSNNGAQTIRTDSGLVKVGSILAEGAVTCGLAGKRQTFAINLIGTGIGVGPVASAGQMTLNGTGGITGNATFSQSGTIHTAALSGTYSANADCTGTAQVTLSGFSSSNYMFVVVSSGKEMLLIETDTNTVVSGTMQQ
jgi:hypothetical protein